MSTITYRPATLSDAARASDLMTAAYPAMAQDPVILRYRWERPREGFAVGRFIGEKTCALQPRPERINERLG